MSTDKQGDSLELVQRLVQGERSALEVLLERHLPALRGYVRLNSDRALRAKESCTDIVQSVCRELLEHTDRFQHPSENAFRHWLYSTALRKIRNRYKYYRAQKRDVDQEVRLGAQSTGTGQSDLSICYSNVASPSEMVMARESQERLEQAFEDLPDEYREVLVLARIVGLSRAEIGEKMGRSENAVRSLLFRAHARLGSILGRDLTESE